MQAERCGCTPGDRTVQGDSETANERITRQFEGAGRNAVGRNKNVGQPGQRIHSSVCTGTSFCDVLDSLDCTSFSTLALIFRSILLAMNPAEVLCGEDPRQMQVHY